ncbi:MAG: hypothetical protein ABGY10_03600 [bacterium]
MATTPAATTTVIVEAGTPPVEQTRADEERGDGRECGYMEACLEAAQAKLEPSTVGTIDGSTGVGTLKALPIGALTSTSIIINPDRIESGTLKALPIGALTSTSIIINPDRIESPIAKVRNNNSAEGSDNLEEQEDAPGEATTGPDYGEDEASINTGKHCLVGICTDYESTTSINKAGTRDCPREARLVYDERKAASSFIPKDEGGGCMFRGGGDGCSKAKKKYFRGLSEAHLETCRSEVAHAKLEPSTLVDTSTSNMAILGNISGCIGDDMSGMGCKVMPTSEVVEEPDSCGAAQAQCLQLAQEAYEASVAGCVGEWSSTGRSYLCDKERSNQIGGQLHRQHVQAQANCASQHSLCSSKGT